MTAPLLIVTVYGTPAPQGSKRHVGRGVMIESSKGVAPWREAVVWACRIEIESNRPGLDPWPPLDGPVRAEMTFTMARPKSAPKSRTRPDRMPDLSKLIRSTEDALTQAGIWADDARVVDLVARKVYPLAHPDALHIPGAVIRIWSADPPEVEVAVLSSTDDGVHNALVDAFTNPPPYTAEHGRA